MCRCAKLERMLSLFNEGTIIDVRQISRVIRAVELERPPRDIGTSDYESAYNSLIQIHLPKLSNGHVIEYDSNRKTVTVTRRTMQYACLVTIGSVLLGV
ncbi:DUF7344 domain-containing protein [Natronobiforma cellulositropha]|uniref:DUF7344 domain-containing protein n=1 Tax=Natronobiforma cellulositropha TaxID=1679076 RepID=UPI003CCD576E